MGRQHLQELPCAPSGVREALSNQGASTAGGGGVEMTIEDDRTRYARLLGAEAGELFLALSNELQWAYIHWDRLKTLYEKKASRLDILNKSAPFFFWVIQQVLWHDTLLSVARLAGPPNSVGKPQLSIAKFCELAPAEVRDDLMAKLSEIQAKADFAIQWRHRHIAHRELELSLGKSLVPLPKAEKLAVDEVLTLMATALNSVSIRYLGAETAYASASIVDDAESLLYVLRDGLAFEARRQARVEAGEYIAEDWNHDGQPI